jgi:hypothetical protein
MHTRAMKLRQTSQIIGLLVLFQLATQSAHGYGELSFGSVALVDSEFVDYPSQSSNGSVLAYGDNWGPLHISRNSGASYQTVKASVPQDQTENIDWKQVSVSPDGQRIIASSSRGNTGGYVFLSKDSGSTFERLDAIGNANWTGAVFGTNQNELLVLDGVSTIWGQPADGSNCNTATCVGSGLDGSNLEDGSSPGGEHPFAAAFYSNDSGVTWSERIKAPTAAANTNIVITSTNDRFLMRIASQYYELNGLGRNNAGNSAQANIEAIAQERISRVLASRASILESLQSKKTISVNDLAGADFGGISQKTLAGFNQEVAEISSSGTYDISRVHTLAKKWSAVDKVLSGHASSFNDLVVGEMVPLELQNKSLVLRALRGAGLNQIDSVDKVQELIDSVVKENQVRRDRVAARLLANG